MFTLAMFRRHDARPATRPARSGRRPLVESLEGRQVLSGLTVPVADGIVGRHIGVAVAQIVGNHIGTPATQIVGQHIG